MVHLFEFLGAVLLLIAGAIAIVPLAFGLLAAVALDVRDRWRAWRHYRRTGKEWWRGLC